MSDKLQLIETRLAGESIKPGGVSPGTTYRKRSTARVVLFLGFRFAPPQALCYRPFRGLQHDVGQFLTPYFHFHRLGIMGLVTFRPVGNIDSVDPVRIRLNDEPNRE